MARAVYPDVSWPAETPWHPVSFGGSPAIAGEYGQLAVFAARAGYDDTAERFARFAAREALAFLHRMDTKLGYPYEIRW